MRRNPLPSISDPGDLPAWILVAEFDGDTHGAVEYLPGRFATGCGDIDDELPREAVRGGLAEDVTCRSCRGS